MMRGNSNLMQQNCDAVTSGGMCEAEVLFNTSLIYSWSWLSVNTSSRHGLPILWLMVYRSSLYKGFSCKQEQNEGAVAQKKMCRALMTLPLAPCVCALSPQGPHLLSNPAVKQTHTVSVWTAAKTIQQSNVRYVVTHPPLYSLPCPCQFTRMPGHHLADKDKNLINKLKSLAMIIRLWYTLQISVVALKITLSALLLNR